MKISALNRIMGLTVRDLLQKGAPSLAAAIAFYSALSLAPVLLLLTGLAGTLWERVEVQQEIVRQIDELVGTQGSELVENILQRFLKPGGGLPTAIIGILLVLFGATTVFVQLQDALNRLWGVRVRKGYNMRRFLWNRLQSLVLILGLGLLLLTLLVARAVISFAVNRLDFELPAAGILWSLGGLAGSLVVHAVLFATVFKTLPDVRIAWRDVLLGAGLTALLFAAGNQVIGFFLGRGAVLSAYGAASSLFVLLLWMYSASLILLAGAQFTCVYAREQGLGVKPKDHAERVYLGTQVK